MASCFDLIGIMVWLAVVLLVCEVAAGSGEQGVGGWSARGGGGGGWGSWPTELSCGGHGLEKESGSRRHERNITQMMSLSIGWMGLCSWHQPWSLSQKVESDSH